MLAARSRVATHLRKSLNSLPELEKARMHWRSARAVGWRKKSVGIMCSIRRESSVGSNIVTTTMVDPVIDKATMRVEVAVSAEPGKERVATWTLKRPSSQL
jgi:hypothetical protein